LFLGKSTKTAATRAALFDSNMHQIACRLGLRHKHHWGAYSVPTDSLAVFRGLLLKRGERRGGKGRKRRGEQRRGEPERSRGGVSKSIGSIFAKFSVW